MALHNALTGMGLRFLSIEGFRFSRVLSGLEHILESQKKLLLSSPAQISRVRQGHAKIEGFAWYKKEGIRNSQGRVCAFYRCEIQRYSAGLHEGWRTIHEYHPIKSFYCVDDSGMVEVDIFDADIVSTTRATSWIDLLITDTGSELVGNIVSEWSTKMDTSSFSQNIRVLEHYIEVGSPCCIEGELINDAQLLPKKLPKGIKKFYGRVKDSPVKDIHVNPEYDYLEALGRTSYKDVADFFNIMAMDSINCVKPSTLSNSRSLKFYGKIMRGGGKNIQVASLHEKHQLDRFKPKDRKKTLHEGIMISVALFYYSLDRIKEKITLLFET